MFCWVLGVGCWVLGVCGFRLNDIFWLSAGVGGFFYFVMLSVVSGGMVFFLSPQLGSGLGVCFMDNLLMYFIQAIRQFDMPIRCVEF